MLRYLCSYSDHCPVYPHTAGSSPGWNPNDRYFQLVSATADEEALLAAYGKVFFYEYTVILKSNGSVVSNGFIQVENKTIQDPAAYPYWDDTFITNAFVPGKGNVGKLRYYHNTTTALTPFTTWSHNGGVGTWCDSREVDYEFEYKHEENFAAFPSHKIILEMSMGVHLWLTSGHHIRIL